MDEPTIARPPTINQEEVKLEYYSSLLERKPIPPKCLSDDYLDYARSYTQLRTAQWASLTAPSTPTVTRDLPESELSETESSDGFRQRCNSLESFPGRTRRTTTRRTKVVRQTSPSSTSSYDSRPELAMRKMRKSASCHVKTRKETCRCLTERPAVPPCGTKSLPRNHKPHFAITRHLSDALQCEKDCLQILKAVSKEVEEPSASYSRRSVSETGSSNQSRYPKTAEIKKLKCVAVKGPALALVPPPSARFQSIDRMEKKRTDKCVLRIEDGNLWIEICKAVQETESRARKTKPRD